MRVRLATGLTLFNAALVAAAIGLTVAVMGLLARQAMIDHLEESVAAELHALKADHAIDGPYGVSAFIQFREAFQSRHHRRRYRLENADGAVVAGSWPAWPVGLVPDGPFQRLSDPGEGGGAWWAAAAELPDGHRVLVAFSGEEVAGFAGDLVQAAGLTLLLGVGLALAAGHVLHRASFAPIGAIRRSAERIIDGELGHRIPVPAGQGELAALTRTLNRMLERIEQLIASLRNSTEAIAHDLRSPLVRHRNRLEQALQEAGDEADRRWIETALAEIDQVLGTFRALLQLATLEAGTLRAGFQPLDLAALVEDVASLYEPEVQARDMRLRLETAPPCPVSGDRQLLFLALSNLLDNALKYGPAGQTLRLCQTRDDTHAELVVQDEGPGLADGERAFERLFRGDRTRQTPGHGLGLTLVRAIARLHGGEAFHRAEGPGATLVIRLPLVR